MMAKLFSQLELVSYCWPAPQEIWNKIIYSNGTIQWNLREFGLKNVGFFSASVRKVWGRAVTCFTWCRRRRARPNRPCGSRRSRCRATCWRGCCAASSSSRTCCRTCASDRRHRHPSIHPSRLLSCVCVCVCLFCTFSHASGGRSSDVSVFSNVTLSRPLQTKTNSSENVCVWFSSFRSFCTRRCFVSAVLARCQRR